jgi:hypothetical protein
MRAALLAFFFFFQAAARDEPPVAKPEYLRYQRSLNVVAGAGQACAVLDAGIYPHAAPALKDLRLFPAGDAAAHEVPYAMTLSEAVEGDTEAAQVLNLGKSGSGIVFDLEMPGRAYTDVLLDLDGHDFLATAKVSGADSLEALHASKATALGEFTLFDLTAQRLSRDMTLPLQESSFRYLHVVLNVTGAAGARERGTKEFTAAPGMVLGAEVPPSREAQTIYTTVGEVTAVKTSGRESTATFAIPARVPVERVSFVLAPGFKGNFSRDVRVTAEALPSDKHAPEEAPGNPEVPTDAMAGDEATRAPVPSETVRGTVLRVHTTQAGHELRREQMSMPATLGANLQREAKIAVTIENGDDQPLPIAAVRLEMRQRKLCFEAPAAPGASTGLALFYGDSALVAPVYDYARLFTASDKPLAAELGPELVNPGFHPRPVAAKSFTERHPEVLWIALLAVVCVLGMVALRSARKVGA